MIKFAHVRNKDKDGHPTAHGGITVAYDVNDDNEVIAFASARCSRKENYCKAIGRTIATGRLDAGKGCKIKMPKAVFLEEIYK